MSTLKYQADPGAMTNYGGTDAYGFGQYPSGVVRTLISGSFSAAKYCISIPTNSNLTTFADLLTDDANTATCTALNFVSQNNISVGNNLTVSGIINCKTLNNAGGDMTFTNGAFTSNLTLRSDGSCSIWGGTIISLAQISSNCFTSDATYSYTFCYNSTDYGITQSLGGLSKLNAKSGNAVQTAVNNTLTSSHSANGF
jgi:hypothetical protein